MCAFWGICHPAIADAIGPGYRLLVLLAALTTLPFGELAALRRRDIHPEALTVIVRRAQPELQNGRLFDRAPKPAAGVRTVSFPAELLGEITSPPPRLAVMVMPSSGRRADSYAVVTSWTTGARSERRRASPPSCTSTTCGTRARLSPPRPGPSMRELMPHMGHSSSRAALMYQHMASDRDRAIADRLGAMIRDGEAVASDSSEKDLTGS
jgi:integrase